MLDGKLKEAMELANFLVFKFPENSKGYAKKGISSVYKII